VNSAVCLRLIRFAGTIQRLIRSRYAGCDARSRPRSTPDPRASTSACSARKFGWISSGPSGSELGIRGRQSMLCLKAQSPYPDMVLEVSADARQVDEGLDAELLEVSMWTNARQQQEARRVDGPGADDQLSGRTDGPQLAVQQKIDA